MMFKFREIRNEIEDHPKKYPALHKIWRHKQEIHALLGEATKELKTMIRDNPEKFPNGRMILAHIEKWKEEHKTH
jgi:hypothetical protein